MEFVCKEFDPEYDLKIQGEGNKVSRWQNRLKNGREVGKKSQDYI